MCNRPSKSIGRERPATKAAGIIITHLLFGKRSSGYDGCNPMFTNFPISVFEVCDREKTAMMYVMRRARKDWKEMVRAIFH
jgi:hypothetical protein